MLHPAGARQEWPRDHRQLQNFYVQGVLGSCHVPMKGFADQLRQEACQLLKKSLIFENFLNLKLISIR
jgi:hypothetical protein